MWPDQLVFIFMVAHRSMIRLRSTAPFLRDMGVICELLAVNSLLIRPPQANMTQTPNGLYPLGFYLTLHTGGQCMYILHIHIYSLSISVLLHLLYIKNMYLCVCVYIYIHVPTLHIHKESSRCLNRTNRQHLRGSGFLPLLSASSWQAAEALRPMEHPLRSPRGPRQTLSSGACLV